MVAPRKISDRSPRIAYLSGRYPAVSLTFIQREIEALRELGAEIVTCSIRRTPPSEHPGPAEKAEAAATFYVIDAAKNPMTLLAAQAPALLEPRRYFSTLALAWRTRSSGLKAWLYQLFYFVEATVLARHLKSEGVERVHNHFISGSATVTMLAARLAGLPYSFTLHGPADLIEPRRWRLDEKIARAEFVACISHYARSQAMLQSAAEDWVKLRIIHCGVMPERYRPGDKGEEGLHLVFVGRLAPVKGLRVLLEALEEAAKRVPGLRLTIVGDGEERAALEALARPLGDLVRFTGYLSQDEVSEMLASADAVVLPSFAEGVPVVLMEAMAAEVPVIATRVAGVAELVEDGVSGFVVPPGDPAALVEGIVALASDAGRRKKMGKAGRVKVEAEFDVRREAARLLSLFDGTAPVSIRPPLPKAD